MYILDLKNKDRHGIFMVISVILEGCLPPQNSAYENDSYTLKGGN